MSMFRELMTANASPYKKLQYLQSTDQTQVIKTGVLPQSYYYMEIDVSDISGSGGLRICGMNGAAGSNPPSFCLTGYVGGFFNSKNSSANIPCTQRTVYGLGYFNGKYVFAANGAIIDDTFTAPETEWELPSWADKQKYSSYLFAYDSFGEVGCNTNMKCYAHKIINNRDNITLIDLIPVLWNANTPYIDGNTGLSVTPTAAKPGMFDKVSKRLFVNQGTGADFLYA